MQKIMAIIMSEGLPQKLKCIKMGLEERGLQAFLKQLPLAKRKVCIERETVWPSRAVGLF